MLAKVYTVTPDSISVPRENFSGNSANKFYSQWNTLKDELLLLLFDKNRISIGHRAARLKCFSDLCREDTTHFHITHGDAGGNLITNGDRFSIVDWDTPVLAPMERDAWFCMSWDWAITAFHAAIRENVINYTLRPERLAYYCYDSFFSYLTAYLDGHAQADTIEEYINGWIEDSIKFADKTPCVMSGLDA